MDLKTRIEAARAAKQKAEAAITEGDAKEIAERAELAQLDAERASAEKKARGLDLARREDDARAKLGSKVLLRALDLEESTPGAGTYILRTPAMPAWDAFRKGIGDAGADHGLVYRSFAIACVHDFNGGTDITGNTSATGAAFADVLREFPAVAMTIANVGGELAGLADTRKKSGG